MTIRLKEQRVHKLLLIYVITVTYRFLVAGNCAKHGLQILKEPDDFDGPWEKFYGLEISVKGPEDTIYEWYHNDTLINHRYTLNFRFHTRYLQVINPYETDLRYQGTYQVFISSAFGKIFGRKIRVKFKVFGSFIPYEVTETRQVVIGQPYSLKCPKHSYSSDCLYKWGTTLPASGLRHIKETRNRIVLEDGTLYFSSIQEKDVRDFSTKSKGCSCILECTWCNGAKMSHGIVFEPKQGDSKPFGPKIITTLKDREVLLGTEYVVLRCAAAGSPAPSYRWVKINNDGNWETITATKYVEVGSFNHSLTLHNITKAHNGTYGCIVTSNSKQEQIKGKVTVREKPTWSSYGRISSQSLDVFSNLTWECKADGDPSPNYTWYANATKLFTHKGRYVISGGKITFTRLLVQDTGMYECVSENGFGYIYQIASLYVKALKPQFNKTNVSVVLLIRSEGVLHCQSNAIPLAKYTWTKDGKEIDLSKIGKYKTQGGHDLVIKKITTEDAGIYKCIATNIFGQDEQTINTTVGEISFVVTPTNKKDIVERTMFSLYCQATSFFKIKYKWRFDNKELVYDDKIIWSLQAYRLLIQNASEIDSGIYECIAYVDDPAKVESVRRAHVVVQGLPRALQGFQLQENCTNASALLVWEPLEIYNYSETYVVIEWRSSYDLPNKWHRVDIDKVNASLGRARVENLTSWANIQFRAISLNNFGYGSPSTATMFKNCKTPPSVPVKCPQSFHGIPGLPGVVEVKWKKLTHRDFYGPGFNYTLKYRRIGELTWKKVVLERTEDHFTILNAGINKLWYFKIRASNNEGFGPICEEKSSFSGQSRPGVIASFTANEVGPTSVVLAWSSDSGKGNIEGFKLQYWQTQERVSRHKRQKYTNGCGDDQNPCKVFLDKEVKKYLLSGLVPLSYHIVSLSAYNHAGDGPAKNLTFRTAALASAKLAAPTYRRGWFITIVSVSCFLMLVVLILFLLRKRSERYPVGKREQAKGGLANLEDFDDSFPVLDVDNFFYPSVDDLEEDDKDASDSVFSTEDKYDDGGSFIGEYGDAVPSRKYEERFV